jgi:hypothetical protein
MRLLAEHHALSGVWLIAHEGCAWYLTKHPHLDPKEIRRRQVADLHRGRALFRERFPMYEIRLIYAAHQGNGVVFDPVEPEPAP